jgi:uncharacterized protein YdhG (YjbR/CyaY superfamily)
MVVMSDYKTIDDYINTQPEGTRKALISLRKCIITAVPDAIEMINYNIPAFALVKNGKRDQQIMMAGYKNHVGLYPHPTVMERFSEELKGYKQGKGSVQFPIDKSLPCDLIIDMVKYRKSLIDEKC